MNVQTHLSGQISGQIPNQVNNQLPGLSQHNGSSISNRIPSLGANGSTMNHEWQVRHFVQVKIKQFIMTRQQNPPNLSEQRVNDIVKRIDDTLWQSASTKEEYTNIDTLPKRLHDIISRLPSSNNNQRHHPQHVNSLSGGTMIPTPGMPSVGNMGMMAASSVGTSSLVSASGSIPRSYQQSPASFTESNVSSGGIQRMASQMIPTPGFSSNNNPSLVNVKSSSGINSFSTVESAMLTQPVMQKQQQNSGQNSRMLHNLGSVMGSGVRSALQNKAYGFSNGGFNEGLGMNQNSLQMLNGSGSSEGYLATTQFGDNTPRLYQQNNQHPQPMMQDSSGPGNFYGINSSDGGMHNQTLNSTNLSSMTRTNSNMMISGSNLQASQQAMDILPASNQYENMNYPTQENLSLPHSQQQSQQPPYHLQQQFYQQQRQPKQQIQQHQVLLKYHASNYGKELRIKKCHNEAPD